MTISCYCLCNCVLVIPWPVSSQQLPWVGTSKMFPPPRGPGHFSPGSTMGRGSHRPQVKQPVPRPLLVTATNGLLALSPSPSPPSNPPKAPHRFQDKTQVSYLTHQVFYALTLWAPPSSAPSSPLPMGGRQMLFPGCPVLCTVSGHLPAVSPLSVTPFFST